MKFALSLLVLFSAAASYAGTEVLEPMHGIYKLEGKVEGRGCYSTVVVSRAYSTREWITSTERRVIPTKLTMIASGTKAVKVANNSNALITDFGNLDPSELANVRHFYQVGQCKSTVTSLGLFRIPETWVSSCIAKQNDSTLIAKAKHTARFYIDQQTPVETISIKRVQDTEFYEITGNAITFQEDGAEACRYKRFQKVN